MNDSRLIRSIFAGLVALALAGPVAAAGGSVAPESRLTPGEIDRDGTGAEPRLFTLEEVELALEIISVPALEQAIGSISQLNTVSLD